VSSVKYELGFYIPEDDILHSLDQPSQEGFASPIVPCSARFLILKKKKH
jgi:hypothetical protein